MQGMKSEKSSDKGALPDSSGHAVKKPEEQKSTHYMQDKISNMITTGVQTKKLIIDHEGDPYQRRP